MVIIAVLVNVCHATGDLKKAPLNHTSAAANTTEAKTANQTEVEKPPEHKAKVFEQKPVVPAGPLPSELYKNVELNKFYEDTLERDAAEKAKGEATWASYYYQKDPAHQLWQYYSLDVAKQLGSKLKITDPTHTLNQINDTLKYDGVSQY